MSHWCTHLLILPEVENVQSGGFCGSTSCWTWCCLTADMRYELSVSQRTGTRRANRQRATLQIKYIIFIVSSKPPRENPRSSDYNIPLLVSAGTFFLILVGLCSLFFSAIAATTKGDALTLSLMQYTIQSRFQNIGSEMQL